MNDGKYDAPNSHKYLSLIASQELVSDFQRGGYWKIPNGSLKNTDRIGALEDGRTAGSFPEAAFERINEVAMEMFCVPMALVSLVRSGQIRFASHGRPRVKDLPPDVLFCARTMPDSDVLVVPDTRRDLYFADAPTVQGAEGIRFYAGALLRTREGSPLGALCVMDARPRYDWDDSMSRLLADLAAIAVDEMELWQVGESRRRLQGLRQERAEARDGEVLDHLSPICAKL